MRIEREVRCGVTVLRPVGRVVVDGRDAASLERAVLGERGAPPRVVLDISGVEFFESDGVDALLRIEAGIARRGGRLALARPRDAVAEIFRINGLDCLFHVFADVAGALRSALERSNARESRDRPRGAAVTTARGTGRSRPRRRRDSAAPSFPSGPSA